MIGKILQGTQGKSCSCPTGKICTACKNKKGVRVKPIVTVEGSSALPVPIKITTYKDTTPTTVQFLQKRKTWSRSQKPAPTELPTRGIKICQWYRKRRALRELDKLTRLERKRLESLRLEKARRVREAEFLEQLKQREKEIRHAEQQLEIVPKTSPFFDKPKSLQKNQGKDQLKNLPKPKPLPKSKPLPTPPTDPESVGFSGFFNKHKKRKKIKSTEAKPVSESKYVPAKPLKHPKDSFNERFVNFCYRICCQFYCCVTFILIIGCIIIFVF